MQQFSQPNDTLVSVPSDVAVHHLFRILSRADLVALSMTCTAMQKMFMKWILILGKKEKIWKARFQSELLEEIFHVGCFHQLVWFQKSLNYLSRTSLDQRKHILIAAKGDFEDSNVLYI